MDTQHTVDGTDESMNVFWNGHLKPLKALRKTIQLFHGGAELPTPISLSLSHWVSFHVYRMLVALSWEKCPAEQKSRGEGHIFLLTGLTVVSDPGEG